MLWNSANLKTDGKCFKYNTWKCKNINFTQDIVNNSGTFYTKTELENKYNIM